MWNTLCLSLIWFLKSLSCIPKVFLIVNYSIVFSLYAHLDMIFSDLRIYLSLLSQNYFLDCKCQHEYQSKKSSFWLVIPELSLKIDQWHGCFLRLVYMHSFITLIPGYYIQMFTYTLLITVFEDYVDRFYLQFFVCLFSLPNLIKMLVVSRYRNMQL